MLAFHVLISLAGIVLGFIAAFGMVTGHFARRTNMWFLITTILTSVSGFLLPAERFLPSHAVGILSLIILSVSSAAFWGYRLQGVWVKTYTATAVAALYFNVFVLVVQVFRHVPVLHALAPTESEPPFQVAQLVVLAGFLALGLKAMKGVKKWTGESFGAIAAA